MADQRLFIILFVGILWGCVLGLQRPAPRYSQQLMPDTSFTCRHKIVGSYYADPETDCQLFHVCVSVAGSIQDYRFLCPNDTAFDQESQTCADWYDVDCEAATLYYASDNFDLYRIGSGLESLHYDSVRTDVEPQDHLQRSESSDPIRSAANNLNKNNNNNNNDNNGDLLKGSSSSNFFNNRNNGKEIDDYDNDGKVYREEKKTPAVQEPRRRQGVRKIARKQQYDDNNNNNNAVPTTARPTPAPESTFDNSQNRNNNYQNNGYNQQRQNSNNFAPSSTTLRPYVEQNNNSGRNNQNNQNNNNNNQRHTGAPSTYRPTTVGNSYQENNNQNNKNNNNNQRYTVPSSTYRPTTVGNSYQENNNNNNNNNAFNNQQNLNGYNGNKFPTTFGQSPAVSSTARPIDYNTNVANKKKAPEQGFTNQFNQFSTQSTTPRASSNGYQAIDYTGYQQKNYNNIQRTTKLESSEGTTPAANFYNEYAIAAARLNEAQNINKVSAHTKQQEFTSQTTPRFSNNFAGSSYIPTTYSPVTKKVVNGNNANQGQAANRGNDQYSTGQYEATRTTNSGQYRERVSNTQQQQSSQVYRNTQSYDTANSNNNENVGQYRDVQSTKGPKKATQYNNYETKYNFNDGSSTKSFDNFDQSKSGSVAGFSPASVNKLAESPVTLRPTTPVARRPIYNSPSTQRPSSSATNFAPQTTPGSRTATGSFASVTPGPFSSTVRPAERQPGTTPKPKTGKKNDYDYAYYDNAGALEYDGLDLEQVSGLRDSAKITRN